MDKSDYTDLVNRKFKRVFIEINSLKNKIHKIEGWLFTEHAYTIDELLNSEHHKTIYAWTEKIGDDFTNWYKAGEFSEDGKKMYYLKREDVDDALQEVNLEIMNRKPTWWEDVKGVFNNFIERVIANMPDLVRAALEKAAVALHLPFRTKLTKIFKLPHFGKK